MDEKFNVRLTYANTNQYGQENTRRPQCETL